LLGRMLAKIDDFAASGTGSSRSRAVRLKGACLAAEVGDP
jgi:hypothetical protein